VSIFDEIIVTELPGMAGGNGYNKVEDLYQAFKERLVAELGIGGAGMCDIIDDHLGDSAGGADGLTGEELTRHLKKVWGDS
jgi:hypothetical protein